MAGSRRKSSTATRLSNGAHQGMEQVADSLESLKTTASEYMDEGRERATELAESFEDTIRERPVTALLAGTAIGFLIGFMMARR